MIKLTINMSIVTLLILNFTVAFSKEAIWKQIYYKGTSKFALKTPYCTLTTPGTFIGSVKKQLKHGTITNKNIHLYRFTFHEHYRKGITYITGTVTEKGHRGTSYWKDKISYYLHKNSQYGKTSGTWINSKCMGHFIGKVIRWSR